MPVEVMARRGKQTLCYGPLKPRGLNDPKTGKEPFAVVQLRRDNADGTIYNLVGFQTHLKWPEQRRVFSMIPALGNAEFVRYGVMHRNTYLDSPRLLDRYYRVKKEPRVCFAGQITGVEGYVESTASGFLAAVELARRLEGKPPVDFPQETAVGALARYISNESVTDFQPMNVNFGIIPPLGYRVKGKRNKNAELSKRALEILDRVFLAEPEDSFYRDRRDHGTVICLACQEPEETCFCGTFGIDPGDPAGDVSAWQWEDALYLRANTEKGAALLAGLPLEEGEETAVAAAQERTRSLLNRLPLRELTTEGFGREEAMLELFHRPEWDQLSESCLGCGAGTFACPTCQCYDIKEFTGNREILRYRCWDSCMYSDFTIMSAGQPRPTQKERFRQRFLHKLQYFPVNQGGIFGCVGCGRCLRQ